MAFVPKEWKARLVEFAGRRTLTNVSTGETAVYDVARNEGVVSQEGDAFSAANMNDLETRISTEFGEINKNMGNCTLSVQSDGAYITYTPTGGADPVTKKLGNANFSFSVKVKGVAKSKANSSERYSVSGTATGSCTDGIVDFSQQFFQSGGYEWNSSADGQESIGVYVQGVTITFDD